MTACNPKSSLYSSRKDLTYLTLKQFCLHQKLFFHYVPLKIFNKVKSLLFNDIHSGYSGVSELFLLFSVHRLRAGSVWKSHTSSENVLEIQSACESMSKTDVQNMPAPWPLPSEVNRSQPGNPSQHCLHVRHFHLNPVCLSFFLPTKPTTKVTATRGTSTGPTGTRLPLRPSVALSAFKHPFFLSSSVSMTKCYSDLQECTILQHHLKEKFNSSTFWVVDTTLISVWMWRWTQQPVSFTWHKDLKQEETATGDEFFQT